MTCHLIRKILLSLLLVVAAALSLQATLRPGYVVTWSNPKSGSTPRNHVVTYVPAVPAIADYDARYIHDEDAPPLYRIAFITHWHRDYGRVALHLAAIWICAFSAIGIVRVTLPRDKAQDPPRREGAIMTAEEEGGSQMRQ